MKVLAPCKTARKCYGNVYNTFTSSIQRPACAESHTLSKQALQLLYSALVSASPAA